MARLEGWEERLQTLVDEARTRPYKLGANDCFALSCKVVRELTGVDRWPEFAGRYHDVPSALALIRAHGETFEAAFSWFFDAEPVRPAFARRGDILAFESGGQKHLGVCLGANTTFLGPRALVYIPTLTCLCAWRVG